MAPTTPQTAIVVRVTPSASERVLLLPEKDGNRPLKEKEGRLCFLLYER